MEFRLVELKYGNGNKKYQVEKEETPGGWVPIHNAAPFLNKEAGLKALNRERMIDRAETVVSREVIA